MIWWATVTGAAKLFISVNVSYKTWNRVDSTIAWKKNILLSWIQCSQS